MTIHKADKDRFTEDFSKMLKIVPLNSLGFFFIGFLIPVITRTSMGATGIQLSLVVSVQVLGRLLGGFITGFITDRINSRKILVLIGSFGRALSYFIIYAAIITNLILLLGVGTFILGFMAGVFWVPFNTIIAEKSSKNHRSQAYGKRDSFNAIGQIFGALLGFSLLMFGGIFTINPIILYGSIPFYGLSNFWAGIRFYNKVDERITFKENSGMELDSLNTHPANSKFSFSRPVLIGIIFLISVLFLSSVNGSIAKPFLNVYLIENIESNVNLVILAYLPAGVLATLFAPILGKIVDRLPPVLGITIISLSGALITWLLINSENIWMFSGLLLVDLTIMISGGLFFQNLVSRITIEHRGKIIGMGEFITSLGSVIGPILGGIAWDFISPQFPFIISIFVELSLIPLYLVVVYYLLPHLAETYGIKEKNQ